MAAASAVLRVAVLSCALAIALAFTSLSLHKHDVPRPTSRFLAARNASGSNDFPLGGDVWPVAIYWVYVQASAHASSPSPSSSRRVSHARPRARRSARRPCRSQWPWTRAR
jgi:hypothetical protein